MKIAIDIKPLSSDDQYRGIGNYTKNLIAAMELYDKKNKYFKVSTLTEISSKYDLCIIPYFNPYSISLPYQKKTRTIITIHDLIPLKFPKYFPAGIQGNLKWQINKLLLKNVDAIITDSNISKNDIADISGVKENKIFVVYPAVSQDFKQIENKAYLQKIKKKFNLPDKFILYVGDCNWNKNIPSLILAAGKANVHLVLVGKVFKDRNVDWNHPWNLSLKKVHSLLETNNHVIRLGFVNEQDLIAIYNLANIYIQPSYYEGFGLSVIEAFRCGCPVISSDKGSLKEIAGKAAFYFNPDDDSDLYRKLSSALNTTSLMQKFRKEGFNQAEKFTMSGLYKALSNVYKTII